MCGVASVWGAPEPELVDRMLARLAHRGPDASGKLESEHGTLGHCRLAIMDPAGGDQPIRADQGRAIVGNGEIYNFPEIRRSLRGRYCFNTGSDTEAALHLYDVDGVELPNPNRKIFEARKRETAALGAGEKLVLGHPLAATIGDSARCMQNLEKVLFTGPKTSDTVTFICD